MKGVLFLCVHNAGRSQMAAGFMRVLGVDAVRVFSAGSEPASVLNPNAVRAMSEIGIDISSAQPTQWTTNMLDAVDVVVTMGCGDACPYIAGKQYVDWPIADPAGQDIVEVRQIRDEIRKRVEELIVLLVE
jgi:protein-tyrosine-phosphatase